MDLVRAVYESCGLTPPLDDFACVGARVLGPRSFMVYARERGRNGPVFEGRVEYDQAIPADRIVATLNAHIGLSLYECGDLDIGEEVA